jgi:hypothetical protein
VRGLPLLPANEATLSMVPDIADDPEVAQQRKIRLKRYANPCIGYRRSSARSSTSLTTTASPFYVAQPHILAGEFVRGHLGDSFGLLPFAHGEVFDLSGDFLRMAAVGGGSGKLR